MTWYEFDAPAGIAYGEDAGDRGGAWLTVRGEDALVLSCVYPPAGDDPPDATGWRAGHLPLPMGLPPILRSIESLA
jgi:hypothetical protein